MKKEFFQYSYVIWYQKSVEAPLLGRQKQEEADGNPKESSKQHCTAIQHLVLNDNNIGNAGIMHLIVVLPKLERLSHIFLNYNN